MAAGVINPCGRTSKIAYSPDGQLLAAAMDTARPNVRLWRLSDGAHVRDLDGTGEHCYQAEFSPDGLTLATAGGYWDNGTWDGSSPVPDLVKLWDVASGALLRTLPVSCGVYATTATFSHDGSLIATAGHTGLVEVWRASDGMRLTAIPYLASVHNARFSADDSQLIVAGTDRRVTVWNTATWTRRLTLEGTSDEMADAAFSPDGGREIATTGVGGGFDHVLDVWDAATGTMQQTLAGHATFVSHVVWVGRDRLVSNDWGGKIIFWKRDATGTFVLSDTRSAGGQSLALTVSLDGKTLVAGGFDPAGVEGFFFLPL
jgi:WD40 repeat protein